MRVLVVVRKASIVPVFLPILLKAPQSQVPCIAVLFIMEFPLEFFVDKRVESMQLLLQASYMSDL